MNINKLAYNKNNYIKFNINNFNKDNIYINRSAINKII